VSLDDRAHTDRSRAESFGSVAAQYDRFRPSYPDALIADLAALNPARALDVACGTGKVAVALLACGVAVLGVEIDPKMAAVARGHGIIVEVGAFETWDDAGRTFDLITCGQGWHWIEPRAGAAKAARVLDSGGTLALFWNYPELTDDVQQEFDAVYLRYAPQLASTSPSPREADRAYLDGLRATGSFADVKARDYRWHSTLTADEWIGRAGTQSDHIRLPAEDRDALFAALRAVIDGNGGTVASHSGTYAIFARNPEP
jgi:SAM-dependent methyltransferase